MTWKISIELDCPHHHAELIYNALTEWAHTGDVNHLHDRWLDLWMKRMSPAVSLEPRHPDDDELAEAVQHLRRLGFDTAAEAVQAARRNLTTEPEAARIVSRLDDIENPLPDWETKVRKIMDHTVRKSLDDQERRLHARAATDTHQARGGRIL